MTDTHDHILADCAVYGIIIGQQAGGQNVILPLYVAGKDGRAYGGFPLLSRDYCDLRLRSRLIYRQNRGINVSLV